MDPLAIYSNISNLRVGLTPTASVTSTVTTLVGNVNVSSNLTVAGEVSNNVLGALSMRAYDDTGIYSATTLTAGTTLPPPFTTKPIMEQQVSTLSLTAAQFGTISTKYSLKINGYVQPPATGTYLFRATYSDGLSMYVASQKLVDSWIYQGTVQQAVGTLTMYNNVWAAFALEHTAGASERLLIEWANPGGTYVTMNSSNFTFAYDMKEVPQSLMGSSYFYGRTNFADTANLIKGAYLPNATAFTGNTSELTNDASFLKSTGTFTGLIASGVGSISTLSSTVGRFLAGSYTVSDSSTNSYSTPIVGAVTTGTLSPYTNPTYGCLSFPGGTLSYIDYNYLTYPLTNFDWGIQDFTAECWLYTTALPSSVEWAVMGRGIANAGNNDWSLNLYPSGKTGFYYYSSASTPTNVVLGSLTVNLGSWNHLAMCYSNSGSILSLYLNGTLSTSAGKNGTQTYSNTYDFVVGALTPYASSTNPGFVGLGPAMVTDIRTVKGVAVYTGSTYTVPIAPLAPIANTVLLVRSLKTGAYMTGTNVGINQINPTYALDVGGLARFSNSIVNGIGREPNKPYAYAIGQGNSISMSGSGQVPATAYPALVTNSSILTASFSGSTSTFTAPVAGIYSLTFSLFVTPSSSVNAYVYVHNATTNSDFAVNQQYISSANWFAPSGTCYLPAGGQVYLQAACSSGSFTVLGQNLCMKLDLAL